ncbi:hypothetical protein JCM11754A_37080 [Isoptericola variabilis]
MDPGATPRQAPPHVDREDSLASRRLEHQPQKSGPLVTLPAPDARPYRAGGFRRGTWGGRGLGAWPGPRQSSATTHVP